MSRINFTHKTKRDSKTAYAIAKRASRLALDVGGIEYTILDAEMDVSATHLNGCPLKLEELLAADDANFGHDVFGIRRFIDRETGKLTGCFCPRFAQPESSHAEV